MDHLGEMMSIEHLDFESVPVVAIARAAEVALKAEAERRGLPILRYYVTVRVEDQKLNSSIVSGGDEIADNPQARARGLFDMTVEALTRLGEALNLEIAVHVRPAAVATGTTAEA